QVQQAACCLEQHDLMIFVLQGGPGRESPQHSSELRDSHRQQFRYAVLSRLFQVTSCIFDMKELHPVREPEVGRLRVVRGHPHAVFYGCVQLVKQVRVHANTDGDGEVSRSHRSVEGPELNLTCRQPQGRCLQQCACGSQRVQR